MEGMGDTVYTAASSKEPLHFLLCACMLGAPSEALECIQQKLRVWTLIAGAPSSASAALDLLLYEMTVTALRCRELMFEKISRVIVLSFSARESSHLVSLATEEELISDGNKVIDVYAETCKS